MTKIIYIALGVAFVVVVLGAYVRLSNAGLGCPDWPGCYGQLTAPSLSSPIETSKAWKEMAHRYVAGTLGLLILFIFVQAVQRKEKIISSFLLLGLVIFQAALGMWTVTLKLHPLVVTAHLLGGFSILGLLGWMVRRSYQQSSLKPWFLVGLVLLIFQIFLGAWTSSNYAAIVCPDFPTCQGHWWPDMNFREAFNFFRTVGPNYEFGLLDYTSRTAIQMIHRVGAGVVFFYLIFLGVRLILVKRKAIGIFLILLVTSQVILGISTIVMMHPLALAVAHNALAGLLFLTLIMAS